MPVVLIGVILLYSNLNIGVFVIVLGVMVWTSRKSRSASARKQRHRMQLGERGQLPDLAATEITAVCHGRKSKTQA